ncbi:MAG TPA: glycosyl transferase family 90 [Chlamydiales bacterium]|nr:glycosyl transferase family 90 [Chlamydiales bacterium]
MSFYRFIVLLMLCFQIHLEAIHRSIFQQKPTPQWMGEQIEHDLAPFTNELSRKSLDQLFASHGEALYLVRVRVVRGKLTFETSNTSKQLNWVSDLIIPGIRKLHRLVHLPDLDFIFTGRDLIDRMPSLSSDMSLLPVFIMSKCIHDQDLILFPDWFALNNGYEPAKSQILEGNEFYPWESKETLLFFRGADSGVWDRSNWRNAPRPKLVSLSLQYPHLINAKFYTLLDYEIDSTIRDTIRREGMMGEYVPLKDHPRYKYVMDIDGHCAAAPRLPLLLHSNSVLFKNMTNSRLWFYPPLKPYVHFIPVAEDLSDLLTQLKWAIHHDEECKKISQNARALAEEILSLESIYLYLYRLLCEYSKKQHEWY